MLSVAFVGGFVSVLLVVVSVVVGTCLTVGFVGEWFSFLTVFKTVVRPFVCALPVATLCRVGGTLPVCCEAGSFDALLLRTDEFVSLLINKRKKAQNKLQWWLFLTATKKHNKAVADQLLFTWNRLNRSGPIPLDHSEKNSIFSFHFPCLRQL